jgi:hypothetical protein
MPDTKVKIDIRAGTIELEGSEAFVTKYLDEFKASFTANSFIDISDLGCKSAAVGNTNPKVENKKGGARSALPDSAVKKTKRSAPKVSAEKFDIHGGDNTPSLKAFFDEKKPGKANGNRIAVVGYYITEILGNSYFTEGQVEYAYKMLGLDRPGHLHQIMINNKNEKDYYEEVQDGESGQWTMTRGGDIFVSDQLPRESE